jgi:Ca2+-binding RTX toxin-like protein
MIYFVGDIEYSDVTTTLDGTNRKLTLIGTDPINGTGNALGNRILGNDSGNTLHGGDGNDVLIGFGGPDRLYGDGGDDILQGRWGRDILSGGGGFDTLTGGLGPDKFVLSGPVAGSTDTITDFSNSSSDLGTHDQLQVRGSDYGLPHGYLDPARLSTLGYATSPAGEGQFVFNPATHTLSWDADGLGPVAGVDIAVFQGIYSLRPSDFFVL